MSYKKSGFTPLEFLKNFFRAKHNNKKTLTGFTLIELLVVIAIIGLLASIVMVSLNSARAKARDARRIADVKQLRTAMEMYYNAHGFYPSTAGAYQVVAGTGTALQVLVTEGYLSAVPSDPQSNNDGVHSHEYYYGAPGWWNTSWPYQIQLQLENRNDTVGDCSGTCSGADLWDSKFVYSEHP